MHVLIKVKHVGEVFFKKHKNYDGKRENRGETNE